MELNDEDILRAPENPMRKLRGGRVSMIMQGPKFSRPPVMSVGQQMVEALLAHQRVCAARRAAAP
ncbi:MAG: hypothetical protein QNK42_17600 [Pseudodonghicola sp.]|nr:hypothetical protein [Pseudodonghicola sp.]